jgi:antitoxin VapB
MAIHVQDEETDWLVREFARRRGVGITAAIKVAVEDALRRERRDTKEGVELLRRRIQPIIDEVKARRVKVLKDDKSFLDEMWGESD